MRQQQGAKKSIMLLKALISASSISYKHFTSIDLKHGAWGRLPFKVLSMRC